MLRTELPSNMTFDEMMLKLYVSYGDDTITFSGVDYDETIPLFSANTLFRVESNAMFNVRGVSLCSFINTEYIKPFKKKWYRAGKRPSHLQKCEISTIELRPWLKDSRCMCGDRKGRAGHYAEQHSRIAAPLT